MATRRVNADAGVTEQNKQTKEAKTPRGRGKEKAIGKIDGAEPKIVTVTFNVLVPEGTKKLKKSVFLTGNLNKINPQMVDWNPKAHQMKRVSDTLWTVSLGAPEGTEIEYKYTLGDWEHVEMDQNCRDTANRRVTFRSTPDEPLNVDDQVHNWRGVGS